MARTTRWTMFLLLATMVWGGLAHASDGPSGQRAYRRATAVALAGGISGVVGAPVAIGGLALAIAGPEFSPPGRYEFGMALYVGGVTAFGSGGALLAGGSLAARHVLVQHGVRISPAPGMFAWATWGVAAASYFVLPAFVRLPGAEWVALSSTVATLALGSIQLVLNDKGARRLRDTAARGPVPMAFGVAPTVAPDRFGVAVVASF